jgi:hypothetical protein
MERQQQRKEAQEAAEAAKREILEDIHRRSLNYVELRRLRDEKFVAAVKKILWGELIYVGYTRTIG